MERATDQDRGALSRADSASEESVSLVGPSGVPSVEEQERYVAAAHARMFYQAQQEAQKKLNLVIEEIYKQAGVDKAKFQLQEVEKDGKKRIAFVAVPAGPQLFYNVAHKAFA